MALVLVSRFTENENIINEHSCKFRQLVPKIQATISIELWRVEQGYSSLPEK